MKTYTTFLIEENEFSVDEALQVAVQVNLDLDKYDLEQFRIGLGIESEHYKNPETRIIQNITDQAKIVLAHLDEDPEYYTKLKAAGL